MNIEYSLSEILSRTDRRFTEGFYAALFARYPRLDRLFRETDMRSQSAMLTVALQILVHWHLKRTPAGEIYVRHLGEKHASMGLVAEDYADFGEVLLESLADFHGQHWTQALADQWRSALSDGVRLMLEGNAITDPPSSQLPFTAEIFEHAHTRSEESRHLQALTEQINRGLGLEDVLSYVYDEFQGLIPFNRIGFALIEETSGRAISKWVKSDRPVVLGGAYSAGLAGSTLANVVETACPRIINDLQDYLRQNSASHSTQLIVQEGMRSSLTCPLIAKGKAIGFLFFSSVEVATYSDVHVDLFRGIASQLSVIVEKAILYSTLQQQAEIIEKQNQEFASQLRLAQALQESMIPRPSVALEGLDVEFLYEPVMHVGGDVLDILPVEDQGLVVFLGDSMGHGVQAAMIMVATKTALHSACSETIDPAEILIRINKQLCDVADGTFVTGICVVLDPLRHALQWASAGHPFLWEYQIGKGRVIQAEASGLPLGIHSSQAYKTASLQLQKGDALVMCTDGVIEARNERGKLYGHERLANMLGQNSAARARELLDSIRSDVMSHRGRRAADDDLTLGVIKALD
jgi:serine phosphatase RsbU (regulator of sigma subunit)/hemoglobin-like flavoprotein